MKKMQLLMILTIISIGVCVEQKAVSKTNAQTKIANAQTKAQSKGITTTKSGGKGTGSVTISSSGANGTRTATTSASGRSVQVSNNAGTVNKTVAVNSSIGGRQSVTTTAAGGDRDIIYTPSTGKEINTQTANGAYRYTNTYSNPGETSVGTYNSHSGSVAKSDIQNSTQYQTAQEDKNVDKNEATADLDDSIPYYQEEVLETATNKAAE